MIVVSPLFCIVFALTFWLLCKVFGGPTGSYVARVATHIAPRQESVTLGDFTASAYPLAADRWWVAVTYPGGRAAWHNGEVTRSRDADGREWYSVPGDSVARPSLRSACRTVANLHAATYAATLRDGIAASHIHVN